MMKEMNVELEKMQFLGAFGILLEAYKIIYKRRKIFAQITLFLIFPLSLFFLAHDHIYNRMLQIFLSGSILSRTQNAPHRFVKLTSLIVSYKWAYIWLFNIAYAFFLSILSLPYTSAVAYTVACILTGSEVAFKQSLNAVGKVWRRLLITSFYSLSLSFTYDSVAAFVILLILRAIIFEYGFRGYIVASIVILFMAMFCVGSLYLSTIWLLSRVVSVLDEPYGFKALIKSQRLLRGKMAAAAILLFLLSSSLVTVQFLYKKLVLRGVLLGMTGRGILGILCLLVFLHLLLLKVILQTLLYFVCKSYHLESIKMCDISNMVGVYELLKTDDARLEIEKLLV